MKTLYTCPDCGSDKVQMFIALWEDANTGEQDEGALAEMYSDLYWCHECCDHPRSLDETEVES